MPGSMEGPLGPLRGMFWDPVRSKYFPNPRQSTAVPNQPRKERPNMRPPSPTSAQAAANKHRRGDASSNEGQNGSRDAASGSGVSANDQPGAAEPSTINAPARGRPNAFRRLAGRGVGLLRPTLDATSHEGRMKGVEQTHWANLVYRDIREYGPEDERVVILIPKYKEHDYLAVYASGTSMVPGKVAQRFTVEDLVEPWFRPRISSGFYRQPTPRHIMVYGIERRNDIPYTNRQIVDLGSIDGVSRPAKEEHFVWSTKSIEKMVCVGCRTVVIRIDYNYPLPIQKALLAKDTDSDMLALHQSCENMVYAGLRNSNILSGDFRDCSPSGSLKVAATLNHKAVVKVKRLDDSAVPFGLLVSGMDDKLVIFDIRFAKQPLRELAGHVNPFHSDLGLATTEDDHFVFAGQSDNRIRAWSLRDGQRLLPDDTGLSDSQEVSQNPLNRVFANRPTAIAVTDGMLDVAVGRGVQRYGRPVAKTT